jgi:D-alanyl-D-alanine carboxypeptidase
MERHWKRTLAALTVFAVVLSTPGTAPASPHGTGRLQAALDDLVAAGAPGAILLDRHGATTTRLASGYADPVAGLRMRTTDRFRGASQMKSFTGVVVLQLVQEGRFRLDDPVDALIPGVIPHGYGAGVTVRHLLQHSSGLFDFGDDPRTLAPYFAGDLGHVWTPQALLDLAFEHPPLFAPGTAYSYSDTGYFLLGYIVEKVTGHSFGAELRRRVIGPLKLRGTDLPTDTTIGGRHAHGYFLFGDPPADLDVTYLYPFSWVAGGITTTADDSARFYRALFEGRLLSPRMMRELKTTIEDPDSDLPTRAGLGVQRWTPCGVAWGHSGNAPGYVVYTWISPDTRHETVLMMNEDPKSLGAGPMAKFEALLARAYCGRS